MSIGELVTMTKAIIIKQYMDESDQRPWAIAYSGGKDSSVVVGLIVSVINNLPKEKRNRKVYIVMSDTIVENPLVHDHMQEQAKLINGYVKNNDLPISMNVVFRDLKESYFVKTLGLGYPLPLNNGKGRWCTDRLKIQPQNKFLKEINPSYIATGVRKAESGARTKSIDKWAISEFIGDHVNMKESHTFNPIVKWTITDVWKYLEMEGLPWGSTLSVRTIYKDATGECGFTNPEGTEDKSVEVCGARHGCWLCPVVLKDRSTEKMSEKHAWLEPLTEWRTLQLKIHGAYHHNRKAYKQPNLRIKYATKAGYNRRKVRMGQGRGCMTIEARKFLFERLIETEKLVNRMRSWSKLEPIKLIHDDEIELIKNLWIEDENEKPFLIGQPLTPEIIKIIEELV